MSAFGTKRTCTYRPAMSAFGGKADMTRKSRYAGKWQDLARCPSCKTDIGLPPIIFHYRNQSRLAEITVQDPDRSAAVQNRTPVILCGCTVVCQVLLLQENHPLTEEAWKKHVKGTEFEEPDLGRSKIYKSKKKREKQTRRR
jgi:hypothetical protein